jgi:hypothetical protein
MFLKSSSISTWGAFSVCAFLGAAAAFGLLIFGSLALLPAALAIWLVVTWQGDPNRLGDAIDDAGARWCFDRRVAIHFRMFTARPAIITTVVIEAKDSTSISALARGVSGPPR